MSGPRKIFVGSLPDGMDSGPVSTEYSKYGVVEEVFMKPGCEPGRQWAFVTFSNPQEASDAVDLTNGVLMFPGSLRPCEVTMARNQGLFGEGSVTGTTGRAAVSAPPPAAVVGPKKIFVGTLPDGIEESLLRTEFSKFGRVVDVFLKANCEPGRQWGFVTFSTPEEASFAKESCDRILVLPGANQPCEVTLAKNQGMYGQSNIGGSSQPQSSFGTGGGYGPQGMVGTDGPSKIFVGSLPNGCNDQMLRAEFSKYGQVADVFIKPNCEQGRQWAFVTFASHQQAQNAKNSTDRMLRFPGSEKTCEVMLAKNQGKFGEQPLNAMPDRPGGGGGMGGCGNGGMGEGCCSANQPPPPSTPPPPHLTPWKMYRTESGLPYYHNSQTGATTWDCPPDLQGLAGCGGPAPPQNQQGCGGWGQQGYCGGGCNGGAYGGGGCGGCGGCGGYGGGCGGCGYGNQGGCGNCGGAYGGGCDGGCGGCGGCGARYAPY